MTPTSTLPSYEELIAAKERYAPAVGFEAEVEEPWLFPFQRHIVRWALRGGRRACFADTGLGKMRMELRWAQAVCEHTGGRVILFAPLAVGHQIVKEAKDVGLVGVAFARRPGETAARIVVTNYDSLGHWSPDDFAGIVLDESSILKGFSGKTRAALTAFAVTIPFRLAATATPSPNDVEELGTHAEFLGVLTRVEMLSRYFINDSADTGTWILKGHAVGAFWEWVASWALSARLPSDVGPYSDDGYILPPLTVIPHVVESGIGAGGDGHLFAIGGVSATTIHKTKRASAPARAEKAAEIIASDPDEPWTVWCEANYEAEELMRRLPSHAVEVSGSMTAEAKASRLLTFAESAHRSILLSKPSIAGYGLNLQRCARVIIAGGSFSYEDFYQLVRRSWRFGQTRPVIVHVLMGFAEQAMWTTVTGKADRHGEMRAAMLAASRRVQGAPERMRGYHPHHVTRLPSWLTSTPETP